MNSMTPNALELQMFFAELLGSYLPGANARVYMAPQPHHPHLWSAATLIHEHTHQVLTENTCFGYFFQMVAMEHRRHGASGELLKHVLANQWWTQESAATYAQMNAAADTYPEDFEQVSATLPRGKDGNAPYFEAYSKVATLFPLLAEDGSVLGQLERYTHVIAVEALARCALNNDVIFRFADRTSISDSVLEEYLIVDAPDERFERELNSFHRDTDLRRGYLERCMKLAEPMINELPHTAEQVDSLLQFLAHEVLKCEFFSHVERQAQLIRLAGNLSRKILQRPKNTVTPLPEVRFQPPNDDDVSGEEFPAQALAKALESHSNPRGLLLYLGPLRTTGKMNIATVIYPIAASGRPELSREEDICFLGGLLPIGEVFQIIKTREPAGYVFYDAYWKYWNLTAFKKPILSLMVAITEDRLNEMVEFCGGKALCVVAELNDPSEDTPIALMLTNSDRYDRIGLIPWRIDARRKRVRYFLDEWMMGPFEEDPEILPGYAFVPLINSLAPL
jgi:hypothetical protein